MSIAVIAGLGNPGKRYAASRHNVGFRVVDAFAERFGASWSSARTAAKAEVARIEVEGNSVTLFKPMDYVNHSGRVLAAWTGYYQIPPDAVAVVYDDITLDPGRLRITLGGSDGGHNGVADLLDHLGNSFVRFRIGIGGKCHPEMNLADFVLGKLPEEHERIILDRMPAYHDAVISLVVRGPVHTMNQFNRKNSAHESNCDEKIQSNADS